MKPPEEKQNLAFEGVPRRPEAARQPIPLFWYSGSEEELSRLARLICHTEPDLFACQETVDVYFCAHTKQHRGGFRYISYRKPYFDASGHFAAHYISSRVTLLCELAFRLNSCIGTRWASSWALPEKEIDRQLEASGIHCSVDKPSAHEKAEAYLDLMDWLDDKLHDPKKRVRFGLPPLSIR